MKDLNSRVGFAWADQITDSAGDALHSPVTLDVRHMLPSLTPDHCCNGFINVTETVK